MHFSRNLLLAVGLLIAPANRQAVWSVDATPVITLGGDENDTAQTFAVVVGATRLANGNILVGDRGEHSIHIFSPAGRKLKSVGRVGSGPGEFRHLARLWRCGDAVVGDDIGNGDLQSAFTLDGIFVRGFRFAFPKGTSGVYRTVCNANGAYAHAGWPHQSEPIAGVYRKPQTFWIGDTVVRAVIGDFPGDERFGLVREKRVVGDRPRMLGKHTVFAIGNDRVYVGTADTYEIRIFDLLGKPRGTIAKAQPPRTAVKADMNAIRDKEIAIRGASSTASLTREYAEYPLPATLPAFASLKVDSDDLLWVQDYPRQQSPTVQWSVFTPAGAQVASVALPRDFEIYEIGHDYVLGRYLDIDVSIPQVRLYRLRRGQ